MLTKCFGHNNPWPAKRLKHRLKQRYEEQIIVNGKQQQGTTKLANIIEKHHK